MTKEGCTAHFSSGFRSGVHGKCGARSQGRAANIGATLPQPRRRGHNAAPEPPMPSDRRALPLASTLSARAGAPRRALLALAVLTWLAGCRGHEATEPKAEVLA